VPGPVPVTIPDNDPTAAIPGEPEDHVPPEIEGLSEIVLPWHTADDPDMVGTGFTLTLVLAEQPVVPSV
jgi:hypothetical protein